MGVPSSSLGASTYLCGGDVKYEPNNLKVVSANLFKANHLKWVQKTMTFSTLYIGVYRQFGRRRDLGSRGCRFDSCHSDCGVRLMVDRRVVVPLVRVRFSYVTLGLITRGRFWWICETSLNFSDRISFGSTKSAWLLVVVLTSRLYEHKPVIKILLRVATC